MAEDDEAAWGEWWDVQYGLCRDVEARLEKAGEDRSDQFRAALAASLIEHLGEHLRRYLKLPAPDARLEGGPGA